MSVNTVTISLDEYNALIKQKELFDSNVKTKSFKYSDGDIYLLTDAETVKALVEIIEDKERIIKSRDFELQDFWRMKHGCYMQKKWYQFRAL